MNRRDLFKMCAGAILLPMAASDNAIVKITSVLPKTAIPRRQDYMEEAELVTRWLTCDECRRIERDLAVKGYMRPLEGQRRAVLSKQITQELQNQIGDQL